MFQECEQSVAINAQKTFSVILLLQLLVITPDSFYSIDISNIYTFHEAVEYQPFHLPIQLFIFLQFIYLQYIIPGGLYSNKINVV